MDDWELKVRCLELAAQIAPLPCSATEIAAGALVLESYVKGAGKAGAAKATPVKRKR